MSIGKIIAYGALLVTLGTAGFVTSQNADYPMPFTKGTEIGRTKNSIAAVIGGVVARQVYFDSKVDLRINKPYWPDAHVTGHANLGEIATDVNDLTFTDVHFRVKQTGKGGLKGEVQKSEYNWDIEQTEYGEYNIHRFLFKFDSDLKISTHDGKITGTYFRHGPSWDWDINGTYDKEGNVKIHVDVPMGLDFDLEGRITKNNITE
jgi:hypothetical protein